MYYYVGDEGHHLEPYTPLLRLAKNNSSLVNLVAGFVPRRFAGVCVREGEKVAYLSVIKQGYMEVKDVVEGSDQHYDW